LRRLNSAPCSRATASRLAAQLHQAAEWKAEKLATLSVEIRIQECLLRSLRTESATLRATRGRDLVMRFGWESAEEIERVMQSKREFMQTLEDLFIESEYARHEAAQNTSVSEAVVAPCPSRESPASTSRFPSGQGT
jgi:hypothetical protein